MAETKWTPEKWLVRPDPQDFEALVYTDDESCEFVARIFASERRGERARLIAAAPELYEALASLYADDMDYIRVNKLAGAENNHSLRLARAILARARGE